MILISEITAFIPGKEYIFNYETQVLTGVPNGDTPIAGMKVTCNVIIQPKSTNNEYVIQVRKPYYQIMDTCVYIVKPF